MTTSNTDAVKDDFLIDLRPLGREVGNHRHVSKVVTTTEPIGIDVARVPAGEDISIDIEIEAVSEGVFVTGTLRAAITAECVHCLSDLKGEISTPITELFVYPGSETADAMGDDDDEVYVLEDADELDLEQAVIDSVVLGLPFAPTCSSIEGHDCPETDVPDPDGIVGAENNLLDPRWAGLEKFKNLAADGSADADVAAEKGEEEN